MTKTTAENADRKQRGRPFPKGVSGNPSGKPKGSRHKTTLMAERMMEADAKEIVQALITAAKAGDMTAAKLVLDRVVPARKGRLVSFRMPPIEKPSDLPLALGAVLGAVSSGQLTPDEAVSIAGLLEIKRRAVETADLAERLERLEADCENKP